jgi:hypothetical protein
MMSLIIVPCFLAPLNKSLNSEYLRLVRGHIYLRPLFDIDASAP